MRYGWRRWAGRTIRGLGGGVNGPAAGRTGEAMDGLISVIVPTYNREDALAAVLRGLAAQRDRGFEIVIADDGSRPATAGLIRSWMERAGVPLRHVRQDNAGFRAAEIRNRAI